MNEVKVTFWKGDFKGENLQWLIENLKTFASWGKGYWFVSKANFIDAYIPYEEYEFAMNNIATY
jgi:hypothetical protein